MTIVVAGEVTGNHLTGLFDINNRFLNTQGEKIITKLMLSTEMFGSLDHVDFKRVALINYTLFDVHAIAMSFKYELERFLNME